jgi:hypothetical protein
MAGYAMLQGKKWAYPMKSLAIIIGRAASEEDKEAMKENEELVWHVDLEINSAIDISRQQAFIAYNFQKEQFEIKNLSENNEIYVNGKTVKHEHLAAPLDSSDLIQIGTEDFVFLLPMESRKVNAK